MEAWELRQRRISAGLTLLAVARAAGTSSPNLSAYERGTKTPNAATLTRLLAAIDAGAGSPVHRNALSTVPATAAAIRRSIHRGGTTADKLRLIRQMRSESRHADDVLSMRAFFAEPTTTGDPRWDAMLAGAVEDLHLRHGRPAPEWTRGHALPTFWFVGGSAPSLDAWAFAHTPMSLLIRGVIVDPDDLEAA